MTYKNMMDPFGKNIHLHYRHARLSTDPIETMSIEPSNGTYQDQTTIARTAMIFTFTAALIPRTMKINMP